MCIATDDWETMKQDFNLTDLGGSFIMDINEKLNEDIIHSIKNIDNVDEDIKLNSELAKCVITLSSGTKMIHHKFYVGYYSEHPLQIDIANKSYEAKSKAFQEAKSNNDMEIVNFITRPYRVPFVYDAIQQWWKPKADEYWDLIRYIWCDTENVYENLDYWYFLLNDYFIKDKHLIMCDDDKKYFDKLPNKIKIYRGGLNDKGLSWTLSKEIAEWFANRFNFDYEVFEKTINKSEAIAYLSNRNEDEIIYADKSIDW